MCFGVMYGMVLGRFVHRRSTLTRMSGSLLGGFMEESPLCNVRFNYVNRFSRPVIVCFACIISYQPCRHEFTCFWTLFGAWFKKNQENNSILIAIIALCRSFTFPKVASWKTSELSRSWLGYAISSRSFNGTCRNSRRHPTRTSRWFSSSTNDMVSIEIKISVFS